MAEPRSPLAHVDFRTNGSGSRAVTHVRCKRQWQLVEVWTWKMNPLPAFYPGRLRFTCSGCGQEITERIV